MLLCCWLAAVGAGLLKTEEILEGVARVRISDDLEFEEENFIAIMNEAREVGHFFITPFVRILLHLGISLLGVVIKLKTMFVTGYTIFPS